VVEVVWDINITFTYVSERDLPLELRPTKPRRRYAALWATCCYAVVDLSSRRASSVTRLAVSFLVALTDRYTVVVGTAYHG
jgi:hypothetical protein